MTETDEERRDRIRKMLEGMVPSVDDMLAPIGLSIPKHNPPKIRNVVFNNPLMVNLAN